MRRFFLIIASLLLISPAFTQNYSAVKEDPFLKDYVAKNWTAADGLPGNTITDLIQDSTGYLYFGTYDGLVRFDGVQFVTFNRGYDEKYDFVSARSIKQDSKGNIWVGSNDEGVIKITPQGTTQKFSTETGLPNNSIRSIEEDNAGNIWIGTAAGIIFFTPEGKIEKPAGLELYNDENILVSQIYKDTAGRIWVTSDKQNGLYVYENKSFTLFDRFSKVNDPVVTTIAQDNTGAFWYGIAPHFAIKMNGSKEELFNIGHGTQSGTSVNTIYQDSNSNIWFARDNGVTVLHNGEFSYLDHTNGLADEKVGTVKEDREGNIWFATDRGGIQRLSRSKFKTTIMKTSVNAIAEDKYRKVVWVAADNGLYCLKNEQFIENNLTNFCKNIRIRDVAITKSGEVLVSTYEKLGQIVMSPDDTIKNWTQSTGLTGNKTRVAIQAKNGDIYVGTTTGLNIISKDGEITHFTKENGITNDYIMCIFEESNGRIWCGTDGGGIFILNNKKLEATFNSDSGLAGNVVFKIVEVMPREIWIFTGTGISKYQSEKDKPFVSMNSANGLGSDGIFQGVLDYTNKLWMTSNKGLFSVPLDELEQIADGTKKKTSSKFFGRSDGLISEGLTSTSKSMKDSLGRIWFTLIDGFSIYDPLNVTANKTAPLIKMEEVSIDTDKYSWNGEKIVLAPGTKRLSLKFTGLSFISSEQMQFRTKLAGFEKDFTPWTMDRNVSYTNLNHGTYKFIFQAQNSDEVLSEESAEITIIKKPYFWELVWFWIAVTVIIIGIATLIILYRFHRIKVYAVRLEKEVQARTYDLRLEKEKSEQLLLNILPKAVADELTEKPNETIAKKYPKATVLFTDIVGFTKMSDSLSAEEVVKMLNNLVTKFDQRAKREGIEKIKTIGDSYMAATGLTDDENNDGAIQMMKFAKGIIADLEEFNKANNLSVSIRVGINTGNLVAGVIGKSKFIYDIWGDTVNVASRMESSGIPGRIHVTENTYQELKGAYNFEEPVEVDVKGKGLMKTYFETTKTE
ncbi:MAG: hypothetical protein KBT11_10665 [Treponema sp.]|nr:hypothetical protein [Candidatus Treponema equifaecale]